MSWKDKMKEFGGGDLSFLSEDGEVLIFAVVGEPILLQGKYKGKPSEKIGCPVMTPDGFVLFIVGKRLARKIAKHEERFADEVFMAIRHGGQNEITSTYELRVCPDEQMTHSLLADASKSDFANEITEAISAAEEVMRQ